MDSLDEGGIHAVIGVGPPGEPADDRESFEERGPIHGASPLFRAARRSNNPPISP